MNGLEPIIQVISILVFLGGGLSFLFRTGAYKNNVENDIEALKKQQMEAKTEIKDLYKKFDDFRIETQQNTTKVESLLIEVKTKIELMMSVSGIFTNTNE